jgi:NAD(P)-dependent dehydrogenase (short-subunit alcohol dehydrogenase family)
VNPGEEFQGLAAVITGGASGIGLATAETLAARGCRVAVLDRILGPVPARLYSVQADVGDTVSVADAVSRAADVLGGLDVLVNNAGIDIPRATTVVDTTPEDWDRVFAVNLRSVYLGCKFAVPGMVAQARGAIVNTASIGGVFPGAANAAYSVSKAGVIMLTKQVARDYAAYGVRSNCVCPGVMQTPMLDYRPLWHSEEPEQERDLAERRQAIAAKHPMGRLVQPDEVAQAIVYLSSDRAAYITGQALAVDGGWLIGR